MIRKFMRRGMAGAFAALLMCFGIIALGTQPAAAASRADIQPYRACQLQGHMSAIAWNNTPYGWACIDFAFAPPFWTPAGPVDMQGYCNHYYPGSRAIIVSWNIQGWKCDGVRV